MKAFMKITDDRLPDILRELSDLHNSDVLVGIPDSDPGRKEGPASNALIGYIQETGSPSQNIPARPFLVPGISENEEKIVDQMEKAAEAAFSGQSPQPRLSAAGMEAQNAARRKINSNVQPRLSERTLAERRRRGVTRTNTLVDTAQLRNAITYVIRKKKNGPA